MDRYLDDITRRMSAEVRQLFKKLFYETISADSIRPSITLNDIEDQLPYIAGLKLFRPILHIGQRKLFLSELQFMTNNGINEGVIIYAGSAPSNHTGFLSSLFPKVKFILIDPNKFAIREARPLLLSGPEGRSTTAAENKKIAQEALEAMNNLVIVNTYFTVGMARAFKSELKSRKLPHFFISDIRTNIGDRPTDLDVIWNLSQQFNWIMILKPKASLVKFRVPYYEDKELFMRLSTESPYIEDFKLSKEFGIDFVADYVNKSLIYLSGKKYIQAWPGFISTETRLEVLPNVVGASGAHNIGQHVGDVVEHETAQEYEAKLFFYNSIRRGFGFHINPLGDRIIVGFDHCGDCALEYHIWDEFSRRYGPIDIKWHIEKLSQITGRSLRAGSHGFLYRKVDEKLLRKMMGLESKERKVARIG